MKQILALLFFISVLACGQKKKTIEKSISSTEIAKQVSAITKDKKGIVSVSIKGIDFPFEYNNENATKKLPMLSVFKFHIGMTVLDLVDQGKLNLNQKTFVKKSELHENTWSPLRKEFPEGNKEFTLAELLQYMVCQSDNNVTDILIRLVGGTEKVQQFIDKKGGKDFTIKVNEEQMHQEDWKSLYENNTTTKSLNQLLIDFYNGKILSKKSTAYMYNLMLQTTTGANKLSEQLPKGSIAHRTGSSGKVGELTIAENDIGIVTLPNGKHYAITVFVSDSTESEETNTKMISEISKVVYNQLSK